jgi:glycolate dehydrogenase FAD-binding subunit
VIERLREVLGEDVVSEADFSPFRVHGRTPMAIVSPWNAEQASAALRVCTENGWPVEPAGAGSWLDWGRSPDRAGIVLSTERMAGVLEFEPADLTISVAAGTPLAEVEETVAVDRQTLGLDPPARPGATIGATIALAAAGPLRLSLGTPRDTVLGLELVTGDGRVVHLGGRVVKNVAGYDLVRLVVGSRGTLGLITQAHVRLRPAADNDLTAVFPSDSPEWLMDNVYGSAARVWPAAVELLSPATAAAIGLAHRWSLLVRCRGNSPFVAEARRRLAAMAGNPEFSADSDAAHVWENFANLEAQARVAVRFATLPTQLGDALGMARAAAEGPGGGSGDDWFIAAHAGNGMVRLWRNEPIDRDAARIAILVRSIEEARRLFGQDGGTVTAPLFPQGPDGFDPFGQSPPLHDLMTGIRRVFDPAGILSPGRFIV